MHVSKCQEALRQLDFDVVANSQHALDFGDGDLGELLVVKRGHSALQYENSSVEFARDSTNGPIGAELQLDAGGLLDINS